MVTVEEKRNFINYFLNKFEPKSNEAKWLLTYISNSDTILKSIRFNHDATGVKRGIVIGTKHSFFPSFMYYKDGKIFSDVEYARKDLRYSNGVNFYLELDYKGMFHDDEFRKVIEPVEQDDYLNIGREYIEETDEEDYVHITPNDDTIISNDEEFKVPTKRNGKKNSYGIIEEVPDLKEQEQYIESLLDDSLVKNELNILKAKIDRTLEIGDKELFKTLSDELLEYQRNTKTWMYTSV